MIIYSWDSNNVIIFWRHVIHINQRWYLSAWIKNCICLIHIFHDHKTLPYSQKNTLSLWDQESPNVKYRIFSFTYLLTKYSFNNIKSTRNRRNGMLGSTKNHHWTCFQMVKVGWSSGFLYPSFFLIFCSRSTLSAMQQSAVRHLALMRLLGWMMSFLFSISSCSLQWDVQQDFR